MRWLVLLLCWLLVPAWLQAYTTLTDQDYIVLHDDILAHPAEFQVFVDSNNFGPIAAAYSQNAAPDCWAWKTSATKTLVYETTSDVPTTWDWDLFTGLQIQAQNSWLELHANNGTVNPSLDLNRAALAKIWKAPATAQQTHILAVWRRKALRGEKLYVSGGNCSTATPSKLTYEGTISPQQVGRALTGPPAQ